MQEKQLRAQFAHCDEKILHAPGKCRFCDDYPEMQQERLETNTNFTGEQDLTKNPRPAEKERSLRDINKWSGNRPEPWPQVRQLSPLSGLIVNRSNDVH